MIDIKINQPKEGKHVQLFRHKNNQHLYILSAFHMSKAFHMSNEDEEYVTYAAVRIGVSIQQDATHNGFHHTTQRALADKPTGSLRSSLVPLMPGAEITIVVR